MKLKLIFAFFIIITSFHSKSQSIEIKIIDAKTKKPISYVNVYSPKDVQGTISNDEGKCIINNFIDTLHISHLAYKEKKIKFDLNDKNLTISLEHEMQFLNEITIYSLNLKEKLNKIRKNIRRFYETKPVHYFGTYKEKFSTNDSLARLFQIQFEWNKKNGIIHDYNNVYHKQNQININSIDYSRILNDTILENRGFVPNSYLFELLSINYYLNFILEYAENISIMSVKKTEGIVAVTFDCDIVLKGNIVSSLKNSVIFFDSKMKYIDKIKLDILYHNQINKGVSRKTKTPYTSSINNHRLYIQFRKMDRKRKYVLNIFKTEFVGVMSYNNLSFTFKSSQEFLITSALRKGKLMSSTNKINLENPFFDSVKGKNFKNYGVKFPLTQQELIFLNE